MKLPENLRRTITLIILVSFIPQQLCLAGIADDIKSRLPSVSSINSSVQSGISTIQSYAAKASSTYTAANNVYNTLKSVTGISATNFNSPLSNINIQGIKTTAGMLTTALTNNPQAGIAVANTNWTKAAANGLPPITNKINNIGANVKTLIFSNDHTANAKADLFSFLPYQDSPYLNHPLDAIDAKMSSVYPGWNIPLSPEETMLIANPGGVVKLGAESFLGYLGAKVIRYVPSLAIDGGSWALRGVRTAPSGLKYAYESPLLRAAAKTVVKQGALWGTFNVAADVGTSLLTGYRLTPQELAKSFGIGFASGAAFTAGTAALGKGLMLTHLAEKGSWAAKIGQQAANGELKGLSRIQEWPANIMRNAANFGTAKGITALPALSWKGVKGFALASPVFTYVGAKVNYYFDQDVTKFNQAISPQSFVTNAIGMSLGSGTLKYDQTAGTFVQDLNQGFRFDNRGGAFWGPAIGVTALPTSVFTGSPSRIAQAIEVNALSPGARGVVDTLKVLTGRASLEDINKTLLERAANPSSFWNLADHVFATGSVGAWLGITENVALKLGASPQTASNVAFMSLFFKPAPGSNQMHGEIAGVHLDALEKKGVNVFKLEPGTFSESLIQAMQGRKTYNLEQKLYKDAHQQAKKNGLKDFKIDPVSSGQINANLGLRKSPFVVIGENPGKLDVLGITDPATGKIEFINSPKGQDSLKQHLEVLQDTVTSKGKSPYAVLGVKEGAIPDDVKTAYNKLAFETHPDTNKGVGDSKRFDEITQAKKIIDAVAASPETKMVYDSALKIKDFLNGNGAVEKLNNQGNVASNLNPKLLLSSAPSLQGVVGEVKEIANKILPMAAAGSEQISSPSASLSGTSVGIPAATFNIPKPVAVVQPSGITHNIIDYKNVLLFRGGAIGRPVNAIAEEDTIGKGVYLAEEPSIAQGYGLIRGNGAGEVRSAYFTGRVLDLTGPKRLPDDIEKDWKNELTALSENPAVPWNVQGVATKALAEIAKGGDFNKNMGSSNLGDLFAKLLQKHGYEGLRMWEGGEGDMGNHISVVVFDPAKVIPAGSPIQVTAAKSAVVDKSVSKFFQNVSPAAILTRYSDNLKILNPLIINNLGLLIPKLFKIGKGGEAKELDMTQLKEARIGIIKNDLRLLLPQKGITNVDAAELDKLAKRIYEAQLSAADGAVVKVDLTGLDIPGITFTDSHVLGTMGMGGMAGKIMPKLGGMMTRIFDPLNALNPFSSLREVRKFVNNHPQFKQNEQELREMTRGLDHGETQYLFSWAENNINIVHTAEDVRGVLKILENNKDKYYFKSLIHKISTLSSLPGIKEAIHTVQDLEPLAEVVCDIKDISQIQNLFFSDIKWQINTTNDLKPLAEIHKIAGYKIEEIFKIAVLPEVKDFIHKFEDLKPLLEIYEIAGAKTKEVFEIAALAGMKELFHKLEDLKPIAGLVGRSDFRMSEIKDANKLIFLFFKQPVKTITEWQDLIWKIRYVRGIVKNGGPNIEEIVRSIGLERIVRLESNRLGKLIIKIEEKKWIGQDESILENGLVKQVFKPYPPGYWEMIFKELHNEFEEKDIDRAFSKYPNGFLRIISIAGLSHDRGWHYLTVLKKLGLEFSSAALDKEIDYDYFYLLGLASRDGEKLWSEDLFSTFEKLRKRIGGDNILNALEENDLNLIHRALYEMKKMPVLIDMAKEIGLSKFMPICWKADKFIEKNLLLLSGNDFAGSYVWEDEKDKLSPDIIQSISEVIKSKFKDAAEEVGTDNLQDTIKECGLLAVLNTISQKENIPDFPDVVKEIGLATLVMIVKFGVLRNFKENPQAFREGFRKIESEFGKDSLGVKIKEIDDKFRKLIAIYTEGIITHEEYQRKTEDFLDEKQELRESAIDKAFTKERAEGFVRAAQMVGNDPDTIDFIRAFKLSVVSEVFSNTVWNKPIEYSLLSSIAQKYRNIALSQELTASDLDYILWHELGGKELVKMGVTTEQYLPELKNKHRLHNEILNPMIDRFNSDFDSMSGEIKISRSMEITQFFRIFQEFESKPEVTDYLIEQDAQGDYLCVNALKKLINEKIEIGDSANNIIKYGGIWDRYTQDEKSLAAIKGNFAKFLWIIPIANRLRDTQPEKLKLLDKLIREDLKPIENKSIWSLNKVEFPVYLVDYLQYGEEAVNLGYKYGQLSPYRVSKIAEALKIGDKELVEEALNNGISGNELLEAIKGIKTVKEILKEREKIKEDNNKLKSKFENWLNSNSDKVPQEMKDVLAKIKKNSEVGYEVGVTAGTARNMLLVYLGKLNNYYDHDFDNVIRQIHISPREFAGRFKEGKLKTALLGVKQEKIAIPAVLSGLEDKVKKFEFEALEELHKRRKEKITEYLRRYVAEDIIARNMEEIEGVINQLSEEKKNGDARGETVAISRSDLGINAIQIYYNSEKSMFEVEDPDNSIFYAQERGQVRIYSGIVSLYDPSRPRPISAIEYSIGEIALADGLRFERPRALGKLELVSEDLDIYKAALKQNIIIGLELPEFLKGKITEKIATNVHKLSDDASKNGSWSLRETDKLIKNIAPFMNSPELQKELIRLIDKDKDKLPLIIREEKYSNLDDIYSIIALSNFLNKNYQQVDLKVFQEKGEVPDGLVLHGIAWSKSAAINLSGDSLPAVINFLEILRTKSLKPGSQVQEENKKAGISSTQMHGTGVYVAKNLVNPLSYASNGGALAVINTEKLLAENTDLETKDNDNDGKTNLLIRNKKDEPMEIPLKYVEKIYIKPELYKNTNIYWQKEINSISQERGISFEQAEQQLNEDTFGSGRVFKDVIECIYLADIGIAKNNNLDSREEENAETVSESIGKQGQLNDASTQIGKGGEVNDIEMARSKVARIEIIKNDLRHELLKKGLVAADAEGIPNFDAIKEELDKLAERIHSAQLAANGANIAEVSTDDINIPGINSIGSRELGLMGAGGLPVAPAGKVGLVINKFHPELGSYRYDPSGEQWLTIGGSADYVYGPDYLREFSVKGTVTNPGKKTEEMIQLLMPSDPVAKRFSDHSAIQDIKTSKLEVEARNLNVDLQLQKRIEQMLGKGFINEESFVIISHGHFIAGAVPFVKAKDKGGNYRFDVAIHFPKGRWPSDFNRAKVALNQQYQLWSEAFGERRKVGQQSAKGKVVALYGHRGYPNLLGDQETANIDPNKLFGTPEEFIRFLKQQGFKKVVIITEEATIVPEQIYEIPLLRLKEGEFAENNSDLYEYMNKLSHLTQVQVVTGDMRPPVGPSGSLAQKLGEEDKKRLETVTRINNKINSDAVVDGRGVLQSATPDTAKELFTTPPVNIDSADEIYTALGKVIEPGQPRPLDKLLSFIIERHSLHDKQGNLLPVLEIHKALASNPLYQNLTGEERTQFLRILDDLHILPLGGLPADKKDSVAVTVVSDRTDAAKYRTKILSFSAEVIKIDNFINNLLTKIPSLFKSKLVKGTASDDIITDSLEVGKRLLGKNRNLIEVIRELTGIVDVSRWKVVLEDVIKRQFEQADYRPFVEPITNSLDAISKGDYLKEVNIIVRDNYVSINDQAGGMNLGEMMAYVVVPKISGNRGKEGAVAQFGVGFYSLHNLLKKPGEELIVRSYTSASQDGYELVYTYKDNMKIENLCVTVRPLKNIDRKQGTEVLIKSSFSPEMVIKAIKEALSYNQRAKIYVDYNNQKILINDLSPFRLITAKNAQALVQEAVFSRQPEVVLTVMGVKIFSIPLTGKNIPERLAVELSEPSLVPRARNQIEVNAQARTLAKGLIEEILAQADWRVVNSLAPLLTRLDEENDSKEDKLSDYLDQRLLDLAKEKNIVFIPDIDKLQKAGDGAILIHPQVFLKLITLGYRPGLKKFGSYSIFYTPPKKAASLNLDKQANNNIDWLPNVNAVIYALEIQDGNVGLVLVNNDKLNGPIFLLNKKYLPKTTIGGIVLDTLIEFILGQRGDGEGWDANIKMLKESIGNIPFAFFNSASYIKGIMLNTYKDNVTLSIDPIPIQMPELGILREDLVSSKSKAAPVEFSLSLLPFIISEINTQGRSADIPILKEKLEEINKGEISIKPLGRQYAQRDIQTIVDQQNIAPYINIRENGQNTRDEALRQGRKGKLDIKTEIGADKKTIVLKFEDDFGMDAAKLIQFLINPGASDKRQDQQLTGRFGTGFFTNLKGAEAVRVKTSLGNYQVVYASLNPIRNAKQETTDIKVSIRQKAEYYKGTEVEVTLKVKGDSEAVVSHVLEKAALYLGLIDKNILEITLNGALLNKGGFAEKDLLAQVDTAYGKLSFYHQPDRRAVTHKQLYVTSINEQYVKAIPPLLLEMLLKHGIIIDLPDKLELISDRSGLTLSDEKLKEMEKATFVAAIKAVARLYIDGLKEAVELFPYDFDSPEQLSSWITRIPDDVRQDLQNIQAGNLERLDIDKYSQDKDKLVYLISLFPVYNGMSITELIIGIVTGKLSIEGIPLALRMELQRKRVELMSKIRGDSGGKISKYEDEDITELSPFSPGILKNYPEFAIYSSLAEFLSKTASLLLGKEIKVVLTADLKNGALAYTWRGSDVIVWNLAGMNRRVEQLSRLLKGTMRIDESEAKELIGGLILGVSHEATHIPESGGRLTHNTDFKTKTIELMQKIALGDNAQKIAEIIDALKNPQADFVPTSVFTKKMAEDMQIVKHYAQP